MNNKARSGLQPQEEDVAFEVGKPWFFKHKLDQLYAANLEDANLEDANLADIITNKYTILPKI